MIVVQSEVQLRYYILTIKRLVQNLTLEKIIALRFAPDEEFIGLVDRTLVENLTSSELKQTILDWKVDNHCV